MIRGFRLGEWSRLIQRLSTGGRFRDRSRSMRSPRTDRRMGFTGNVQSRREARGVKYL